MEGANEVAMVIDLLGQGNWEVPESMRFRREASQSWRKIP